MYRDENKNLRNLPISQVVTISLSEGTFANELTFDNDAEPLQIGSDGFVLMSNITKPVPFGIYYLSNVNSGKAGIEFVNGTIAFVMYLLWVNMDYETWGGSDHYNAGNVSMVGRVAPKGSMSFSVGSGDMGLVITGFTC